MMCWTALFLFLYSVITEATCRRSRLRKICNQDENELTVHAAVPAQRLSHCSSLLSAGVTVMRSLQSVMHRSIKSSALNASCGNDDCYGNIIIHRTIKDTQAGLLVLLVRVRPLSNLLRSIDHPWTSLSVYTFERTIHSIHPIR